jgi:hypothetical protein
MLARAACCDAHHRRGNSLAAEHGGYGLRFAHAVIDLLQVCGIELFRRSPSRMTAGCIRIVEWSSKAMRPARVSCSDVTHQAQDHQDEPDDRNEPGEPCAASECPQHRSKVKTRRARIQVTAPAAPSSSGLARHGQRKRQRDEGGIGLQHVVQRAQQAPCHDALRRALFVARAEQVLDAEITDEIERQAPEQGCARSAARHSSPEPRFQSMLLRLPSPLPPRSAR